MPSKSITHNFNYSAEDIVNLIKGDIARQLKRDTIPIITYSIHFNFGEVYDVNDWRGEYATTTVLRGAEAKVEVPG